MLLGICLYGQSLPFVLQPSDGTSQNSQNSQNSQTAIPLPKVDTPALDTTVNTALTTKGTVDTGNTPGNTPGTSNTPSNTPVDTSNNQVQEKREDVWTKTPTTLFEMKPEKAVTMKSENPSVETSRVSNSISTVGSSVSGASLSCEKKCVRKEIHNLSPSEIKAFTDAYIKLSDNGVLDTLVNWHIGVWTYA